MGQDLQTSTLLVDTVASGQRQTGGTLSFCRYQNIQRTMATEEDGGSGSSSSRLERSSSVETDSDAPPAGTENLGMRMTASSLLLVYLRHLLSATDCVCSASPASPVNQQKISHLLQSPAVKFITNPEFFTVLHSNYVSVTQVQDSLMT